MGNRQRYAKFQENVCSSNEIKLIFCPPLFRKRPILPLTSCQLTKLLLHRSSMFAIKAKIYGVLYNQASSIAFDETSSYWSALKSS